MGQELAHGYGRLGGSQYRFVVGIKALENLDASELWQILTNGAIQLDLALLNELHDCDRRYCFGHRGDPSDGVNRHLGVARYVSEASCTLVDNSVRCRCNGDNSRNSPSLNTGCK